MGWQAVCASDSLSPDFTFTVIYIGTFGMMLALLLAYLCGKDHDGTQTVVRFRLAAWLKMGVFALLLGLGSAWLMHRHTFCEWQIDTQQLKLRLPYVTDRSLRRDEVSEIRLAFPHKHSCGIAIYTAEARFASGDIRCTEAKILTEQLQRWQQTGKWVLPP
ncbi:hypothetical protein [Chitinibacter tainanensis]|uniref:hypothetical protein n=1 Tax=Chitinibacter tainanensis TaxID=230667 RepID=UPI0023552181|nr:hypothetical protein [Chitinibacter tainanensis]